MRVLKVLIVLVLLLTVSSDAFAQRREGLGGKHSARYTTAAQGHITVLAGPNSTQLLGERFGGAFGMAMEAGFTASKFSLSGDGGSIESDTMMRLNAGAAYGITPELEIGAMVLPVQIAPETDDRYNYPSVFATYAKTMGTFDVGVRATGYIPIAEGSDFLLNAGVPFTLRSGNTRVEAGIFVPVLFADEAQLGLSIPVRVTMNLTPKIYAGLDTGYMDGNFDQENDNTIPLGLLGGYTMITGGKVIDFNANFALDNFLFIGAPEGADLIQTSWRFGIGANIQI